MRWLARRATIELALGGKREAERKYHVHESLRWLIEREQKRNLLPILEPVEEKPFVLTED